MNVKNLYARRNKHRLLFKPGSARNVIKVNVGNHKLHEAAKFGVCWALAKAGHDFLTEAEFPGGRADVVDLDEGLIIEILHSEKVENLAVKAKVYPLPIRYCHSDMASLFDFKLEGLQVLK